MNKKLRQQAAEMLTPVGVFLRNSKVYTHAQFYPQQENNDLQIEYKAQHLSEYKLMHDEAEKSGMISFQFEAGIRLVDEQLDEEDDNFIQVEIIAVFTSEYRLTDVRSFDEAAMSEFLNANVRFHVWPFWREYLQSTCTRMGLPVISVPHYFRPQESK